MLRVREKIERVSMRSQLGQWVDNNPLRIWRKKFRMSQQDTSAQLGVSWLSISFWEKGATRPNRNNMQLLINLVGDPTLEEQWNKWYESRPKPVSQISK